MTTIFSNPPDLWIVLYILLPYRHLLYGRLVYIFHRPFSLDPRMPPILLNALSYFLRNDMSNSWKRETFMYIQSNKTRYI